LILRHPSSGCRDELREQAMGERIRLALGNELGDSRSGRRSRTVSRD
jgi:hypothetical protein